MRSLHIRILIRILPMLHNLVGKLQYTVPVPSSYLRFLVYLDLYVKEVERKFWRGKRARKIYKIGEELSR